MNKTGKWGALTLALLIPLWTTGCLKGDETFTVFADGSGTVSMKLVLGKKLSEMQQGMLGKGDKAAAVVQVEAFAELEDQWRGVYWEKAAYTISDGTVTVTASGVFPDIRQVKMVEEEFEATQKGDMKKRVRDSLTFDFKPGPKGGTLGVSLHLSEDLGAGAAGGGAMPPELKAEMEKMLDGMLKEVAGDLALTIALVPPGKVKSKSGSLKGSGEAASMLLDLAAIKSAALSGKKKLAGTIEYEGSKAAPTGFAKRLAAAKTAWTKGKGARAKVRVKAGDMDPGELEGDLKKLDGELKDMEKELEDMEKELEGSGGKKK
jgi:hypothetical protein